MEFNVEFIVLVSIAISYIGYSYYKEDRVSEYKTVLLKDENILLIMEVLTSEKEELSKRIQRGEVKSSFTVMHGTEEIDIVLDRLSMYLSAEKAEL